MKTRREKSSLGSSSLSISNNLASFIMHHYWEKSSYQWMIGKINSGLSSMTRSGDTCHSLFTAETTQGLDVMSLNIAEQTF